MDIRRLRADDTALVEQTVELVNAARETDAPWLHRETPRGRRNELLRGWDGDPDEQYVGLHDGRVVALGAVYLPQWDNRDLAWLGVAVHPDVRGKGFGSAAYDHLVARASEAGRTKLGADAWDGSVGVGFLERRGFTRASQAISRRQHLAEVPLEHVQALYDDALAAATDYELVRVVGHTPEALMPAVAEMTAAINDAPLDDLDVEDEVFPPDRIRAYEQAQAENGMRLYRLLARHRESGSLVGHTIVSVDGETPTQSYQHDTSVVRAHRGHHLGMLLKAGMILWLAQDEPQVATIDTWNAESNDHMIAVNERLGYRWMGRELQFQRHGAQR